MSRIYLSPPHMGAEERSLLIDAFDSNWIAPLGPHVDAFEREFSAMLGVSEACALSSGTAALHLALLMLGGETNDDVFVSDLTFAATANAIKYVGANPVFIDSERSTWNMDWEALESALREAAAKRRLPRAVIVVDLYGQCADYAQILKVCEEYGVPVVEDAAEALGATYHGQPAGTFGKIGIFSFNGNKIITTSGGGMLVAHDAAHVSRARYLATQAREPVAHYEHVSVGYNYRLSNLLAAVGRGQLKNLSKFMTARRDNYSHYRQMLGGIDGIEFMPHQPDAEWNGWLTCILIKKDVFGVDRETVRVALERESIESRPLWKPMHLQPVFRECRRSGGSVAESLFADGLCLPSGSSLTKSEREKVVEAILECKRQAG